MEPAATIGAAQSIGNLARGLLTAKSVFGGKGTYAQGTGLRAVGYVDKSGFHGTVYGLAENAGQKYQDTLTGWAPQSTLSAKAAAAFTEAFGPNSAERVQVDFVGPLTETGSDPQFSDAFVSALKASAPRSGGLLEAFDDPAVPAQAPIMRGGGVAGVPTPSTMQPVAMLPAKPENSGGSALPLLALLAGAAYVMR